MKSFISLLRAAFLFGLVAQITSCQKIIDHWPGHGHGNDDSTVHYRIKSIKYSSNPASDITNLNLATFYYGSGNLLDSIVSPGDPQDYFDRVLRFTYDQNGKLLRFYRTASKSFYKEFLDDKYGYGNNNQIVKDTMRFEGYTIGHYVFSDLSYDLDGRIVKDQYYISGDAGAFPPDTLLFNYDGQGNRGVVSGGGTIILANTGGGNTNNTEYDDKTAYRSTNPIFQMIDRDYSANNSILTSGYNSAGLPLGFKPGSTEEFLDLGEPREIEWEEVP